MSFGKMGSRGGFGSLGVLGGVGAWLPTLSALKTQIQTYGAMPTDMVSSPTFTEGASGAAATLTGEAVAFGDARLRYGDGARELRGATFPNNGFYATNNTTRSDGTREGRISCLEFDLDASAFEIRVLRSGSSSMFRVYADGQRSTNSYFTNASDGQLRWIKVDFGSAVRRAIRIEFLRGGAVGGVKVGGDGALYAPAAAARLRLCVLGDSFVEGTGAALAANGIYDFTQGFSAQLARRLGFSDFWLSGFGGTGYAIANGTAPALVDRISGDGVGAAADVYVIAMGINGTTGQTSAINTTLSTLRSGRPRSPIFGFNRWNPSAPTPLSGTAATISGEIAAAWAGRGGMWLYDPSAVVYELFDGTHPDQNGHDTLGLWGANQIKATLGLS